MPDLAAPAVHAMLPPGPAPRSGHIIAALCGHGDSPVLHATRALARQSNADAVVLSVIEPRPFLFADSIDRLVPTSATEAEVAARRTAVVDEVERAAEGAEGNEPLAWPIELRVGPVAETIATEAADTGASLVVMGIGRHHPIDRLLGAETTLSTIRRSSCPVFAVVRRMRTLPRVVIAATDFNPASVNAIVSALPLLADDARLYVVHVWSRQRTSDPVLEAADVAYERALPERFVSLRERLALPAHVTFHSAELVGEPAREVVRFAHAHGADLIVAGTVGRGFIDRLFVGSVATAILRAASSNVLIAPEPQKD